MGGEVDRQDKEQDSDAPVSALRPAKNRQEDDGQSDADPDFGNAPEKCEGGDAEYQRCRKQQPEKVKLCSGTLSPVGKFAGDVDVAKIVGQAAQSSLMKSV